MPENSFELENTLDFKKFSLIYQLSQFGLFLSPSRFFINMGKQKKIVVTLIMW